jgi:hypothetical protein
MARRQSTSENTVEDFIIDFSKEESGGGIKVKDGWYLVKILNAKPTVSTEKGTPGLQLTLAFKDGKKRGKKFTETLWATPKAYSRFRTLLEACGKKVPERVNLVKIAAAIKGADLMVEMELEAARDGYTPRSRVTFDGFVDPDEYEAEDDAGDADDDDDDVVDDDEELSLDDDDDEPAEPAKKAKKKKAKKPAKDDEFVDDDELDLDSL